MERRYLRLLALALFVGGCLVTLEMVTEDEAFSLPKFMLDTLEMTLIVVGAAGVFLLFKQMRDQHRERLALMQEMQVAQSEGADWRARAQGYIEGLGAEIAKQFDRWGLTQAEREVGLLLLKGMSHKEIASIRGTAEGTVRQQARSIYQKSELPSKTAFSAYFLEDLLPAQRQDRTGGDAESEIGSVTPRYARDRGPSAADRPRL